MKWSANIEVLYKELPFEERFAAAKKDGFDYIEFWDWNNKNLDEVNKLLDANGLAITGMSGDGPISMCDPERGDEYLDFIKQSIEAAKKINCPVLIVHSNELLPEPQQYAADTFDQYSDTVKTLAMFRTLSKMAPLAEEAGVTFCLEALNVVTDHLGNFLQHTKDSAEITSMVESPNIKVLYDAYHMYLNEGKTCETITKYLDQIGYIHIADAPGRAEPGTGAINYRKVFEVLKDLNYSGAVGFELYPKTDTSTAVRAIQEVIKGL